MPDADSSTDFQSSRSRVADVAADHVAEAFKRLGVAEPAVWVNPPVHGQQTPLINLGLVPMDIALNLATRIHKLINAEEGRARRRHEPRPDLPTSTDGQDGQTTAPER